MIFTYEMLYEAWKKTVVFSSEEPNRAKYRYYIEVNLTTLLEQLKSHKFKPTKLRIKIINYPKKREVQVPAIRDKIVQHAICDNYLIDIMEKPIIKETSACLKGKGTLYAIKVLKNQLSDYYRKYGSNFYVLQCDIHKYFASIPHERLFKIVERYVDDPDVKELIHKFVNLMPVGLALGLQQSQLLANIYLSDLDHKCKELLKAEYFGRYMDDFYIISNDYQFLENCLDYIKKYVESIGLTLNKKTAIHKDSIDFLGFTFHISNTGKIISRVERGKKKSKRRQIKKMIRMIESGEMDTEQFALSYYGWRNHALKSNSYSLVKSFDDLINEELKPLGLRLKINKKKKVEILCQEQ